METIEREKLEKWLIIYKCIGIQDIYGFNIHVIKKTFNMVVWSSLIINYNYL